MRYRIVVTRTGEGWEAWLWDEETKTPRAGPRHLRRLVTPQGIFPLPPAGEVEAPPEPWPESDYRVLCQERHPSPLGNWVTKITNRSLDEKQPTTPFARYLFCVLLGDKWWQELQARADGGPLELELAWEAPQQELHGLPWEMMHDGGDFLAKRLRLALTRRVLGAKAAVAAAPQLLRVLFVSGTHANDPNIRAGAEFLAVLRNRQLTLPLRTHLLLQATPQDLEKAVAWFKPTVVHFICHGDVKPGVGGYLKLYDRRKVPELHGEDLVTRITRRSDEGQEILPQVVVLNACYSAAPAERDLDASEKVTLPLAVELVNRGIPVVVGMGGRVADQACRLFASRFYEALLEDGAVVRASAEGRRFGIRHGSDPLTTVDWAMPTLVLAEGVADLPRWQHLPSGEVTWRTRATDFVPVDRFPVFCDRLAFWNKYSLLMTPTGVQEQMHELDNTSRQFLLIPCEPGPPVAYSWGRGRLGRTWLLEEFAAQAVRDGHLPCLIRLETDDPPKTLPALVDLIRDCATEARTRFGLNWEWSYVNQLEELPPKAPPPETFPKSLKRVYREFKKDPGNPNVVSAAVCHDLLALVAAARSGRAEPERIKLLLLFDDLHRLPPEVVADLFRHVFSPHGLRSAAADLRIALLYCADGNYKGAVDAINLGVSALGGGLLTVEKSLDRFGTPEDRLAYEHFMLHWRRDNRPYPVTVRRPSNRQGFLTNFANQVGGIPSELKSKGSVLVNSNLTYPPDEPHLREANDEELADFIARQERRGG